MLLKTKGIVLRFVKYKESSVIATIYTQEEGLVSVIANSVRSKSSKGKIALYQPLSLIELVIYHNRTKSISRVSDIRSYHPLHNLRQNPIKSSIGIFLTEIINKCIKEEESNPPLFNFIQESILYLNEQSIGINNFHLIFLLKLSLFLGFKPHSTNDFINQLPNASFYKEDSNQQILNTFLSANYDTSLGVSSLFRQTLLNDMLMYYQNHLDLGKIKSIKILHELLLE